MPIIDAWARHPTRRFLRDDMFDSLRCWGSTSIPAEQPPVSATLAAMDAAGVNLALISAWYGPQGE